VLLYNNVAELRQKLAIKALIRKNNGMRFFWDAFFKRIPRAEPLEQLEQSAQGASFFDAAGPAPFPRRLVASWQGLPPAALILSNKGQPVSFESAMRF
jgi:hypothetical protein